MHSIQISQFEFRASELPTWFFQSQLGAMPHSESDNDSESEDEEKLQEDIRGFEAQVCLF
jgi:hypothetical protein